MWPYQISVSLCLSLSRALSLFLSDSLCHFLSAFRPLRLSLLLCLCFHTPISSSTNLPEGININILCLPVSLSMNGIFGDVTYEPSFARRCHRNSRRSLRDNVALKTLKLSRKVFNYLLQKLMSACLRCDGSWGKSVISWNFILMFIKTKIYAVIILT